MTTYTAHPIPAFKTGKVSLKAARSAAKYAKSKVPRSKLLVVEDSAAGMAIRARYLGHFGSTGSNIRRESFGAKKGAKNTITKAAKRSRRKVALKKPASSKAHRTGSTSRKR